MKFLPAKRDQLIFKPFWDDLARSGVETVVFDAMALPLSQDAPGFQVINWNTQCNISAYSNRPEILRDIKRRFGNKPIGDEIPVKKSRATVEKLRDDLIKSVRIKTNALLWVMQNFGNWRFLITSYFEGHRAGHNMWPIWEDFASDSPVHAMLDVYREIDAQIGRVLRQIDLSETMFILFSMHGMAPAYAQDHFLPSLIQKINRLYLKKQGYVVPDRQVGGLARLLRQNVPPSLQRNVRQLVGQTVQDWLVDREWRGGKDWKQTPSFPVPGGGDVGFIRLSIQGRERDGFLAAGNACDDYLEFLRQRLTHLRVSGTNEPLVDKIVLTHEAFPGRFSHMLPDVLVTWRADSPATAIWSEELGHIKATLKTGRGGNHTGESFAVIAGATSMAEGVPPPSHIRDYRRFLHQFFAQD